MAKLSSGGGKITVDVNLGQLTKKQELFCGSKTLYTAYGGARGGGKTHAVRWKAVAGALRYEGIRILIIRRTLPRIQSNHIEPIQNLVPQEIASYNGTLHTCISTTGPLSSSVHYSGVASETEYMGPRRYDWIFLDESDAVYRTGIQIFSRTTAWCQ